MAYQLGHVPTSDRFVLAAQIKGQVKKDSTESAEEEASEDDASGPDAAASEGEDTGEEKAKEAKDEVNVVFVTDIDLLHSDFLRLRARPDTEINWQFDNVTFVLNILDVLAGDDRLVEIRKRQTRHSTLKMVDVATADARDQFAATKEDFEKQFQKAKSDAEEKMNKDIQEFQKKLDEEREKLGATQAMSADVQRLMVDIAMKQNVEQRRLEAVTRQLEQKRDSDMKRIEQDLNQEVLSVQNQYKTWAVLLPPIPPLLVGLFVFLRRRQRESEGISRQRRR